MVPHTVNKIDRSEVINFIDGPSIKYQRGFDFINYIDTIIFGRQYRPYTVNIIDRSEVINNIDNFIDRVWTA